MQIILFLFIKVICYAQQNQQSSPIIIQMSSDNEVFYQEIPSFYNQTCQTNITGNYTPCNLTQSTLNIQQITTAELLTVYHYYDDVSYWIDSGQGIIMLMFQQNISANYSGIILFNSSKDHKTQRSVILYNLDSLNQIFEFNVATPSYLNNTLSIQIQSTFYFQFSNQIVNQEAFSCSNLTILYVGQSNYSMYCQNGSQIIIWSIPSFADNPALQFFQCNIINNNTLNISEDLSIQDMAINPLLYLGKNNSQVVWSIIFSSNDIGYICDFNETCQLECNSLSSIVGQIQNFGIFLSQWWVPLAYFQTSSDVYLLEYQEQLIQYEKNNGSGNVYITKRYMYFEDESNGVSYLIIYKRNTNQLVSQFPIDGNVIITDNDYVFFQSNGSIYLLKYEPIYLIINSNSSTTNNNFSVMINSSFQNSTFNYTLYLTNFSVPFFLITKTCSTNQFYDYYSSTNVLFKDISSCYLIMGPLIDAYLNAMPSPEYSYNLTESLQIKINQISYNLIVFSEYNFLQNNQITFIQFQQSQVGRSQIQTYNVNQNSQTSLTQINLCNFTLDNLTKVNSINVFDSFFILIKNKVCKCSLNFSNCQEYLESLGKKIIHLQEFEKSLLMVVEENNKSKLYIKNSIQQLKFTIQQDNTNSTKIINFNQILLGRIVSLFFNNTIVVMVANLSNPVDFQFNVAYTINMNCSSYNSTQITVQKGTHTLIAYCYNSNYLWEYQLNNTGFLFIRLIPIYNLITTNLDNAKSTKKFYFIPVMITSTMQSYIAGSKYYLVLEFDQFTTSTMQQLINSSILEVLSSDLSLIIYDDSTQGIKIIQYVSDKIWLGIQLNTNIIQKSIQNVSGLIYFSSIYNYNYIETIIIEFNLTQATIYYDIPYNPIKLTASKQFSNTYTGVFFINYDAFFGTIDDFYVIPSYKTGLFIQYDIKRLIEPNKIVGKVRNPLTNLISLDNNFIPQLSNNSLNNLIIGITKNEIIIFEKIAQGNIDFQQLQSIDLNSVLNSTFVDYCLIDVYNIINQSTISFLLQCGPFKLTNAKGSYPVINISYTQFTNNSPSIINYQTGQINIPQLLQKIHIIPNQIPVIIGIIPQSFNTLSSSLLVCNNSNCSKLYNYFNRSTYILIDYDVLNQGNMFIIGSLDLMNLNFWINNISQDGSVSIGELKNMSLNSIMSESNSSKFDMIRLINYTQNILFFIMGSDTSYITFFYNFDTSELQTIYTYVKFYQCAGVNLCKPQFTFNSQAEIDLMIVQCSLNQSILQYQQYQNILGQPIIYTSFLQIFHTNSGSSSSKPIRSLSIDSHAISGIFAIYNGLPYTTFNEVFTTKILYQQIGGILIDNRLTNLIGIGISVYLEQLHLNSQLQINFSNSYFWNTTSIDLIIQQKLSVSASIVFMVFFVVFDLITIVMIVWWCIKKRKEMLLPKTEIEKGLTESDSNEENNTSQFKIQLMNLN